MSFKKLLLVITIIIVSMFALMLTTSYAWYSFEKGSTTFEAETESEDIFVSYQDGEYINTDIAVPVNSEQIDKYASKNNFNIKVTGEAEILIGVSLIDVTIEEELKNKNFVVDLFYQGSKIDSINGEKIISGTDILFENVLLNNDASNQFEIRMYILDDGTNQNIMMNRVFSAKVRVDVVSRLNPEMMDYENTDISIESIIVDGEVSEKLPVNGYYDMTYTCDKGSKLRWDSLSNVMTYSKGSYVDDVCNVVFVSSEDYPLLSEMPIGSYVLYSGTNGCVGKNCSGYNTNYVSEDKMGYCQNSNNQFMTSGWRIGYVDNGNTHLISAGATDCMCTNSDGNTSNNSCDTYLDSTNFNKLVDNINKIALNYCNTLYADGGICDNTTVWAMRDSDFNKIINNTLNDSSCYQTSGDKKCGYNNSLIDNGSYYWIVGNYDEFSLFSWSASSRNITSSSSNYANGIRPVLKLSSNIIVVSGEGTYNNPYVIKNK